MSAAKLTDAAHAAYEAHQGQPWDAGEPGPGEPAALSDLRVMQVEFTYGSSWPRTALDMKTRSLITLSILATMGGQETQFVRHLERAHRAGATKDEIVDLLFHLSGYVGVPRAAAATATARRFWNSQAQADLQD